MSKELEAALVEMIHHKLGKDPSVEKVVAYLFKGGAISAKRSRQHLIRAEFFRQFLSGAWRYAADADESVAEKYKVTAGYVRRLRLKPR